MTAPRSSADDATLRQAIEHDGWCTRPAVLSPDDVDRARRAVDEVFDAETDIAVERGWRTAVHHVAYAVPAKHATLLDLALHPAVVAIARTVLGDDCVLAAANGFDVVAASPGQALHRDHPDPTPGTTLFLHVVCALDDLRADNGATLVVPGSHRAPLASAPPEAVARAETPVVAEVPAGGAIVYDGCVVHGSGPNPSGDRRRALHLFFARPWVQPHWDFMATFGETGSALDDDQRRLLGFYARPRRFDLAERRVRR